VRAANLSDTSPWSSIFRLRMNGINLADRLVAYYPFNGNAEDSVGNSNGTLQGDVARAPDRYGKADQAYSFDGNGDYIILPESDAFTSIDREITVSAWVYPNSLDFETGLIHRDRFWRLFFYSDGTVVGNIFDENGSENRTGSSTKAPLNQWSLVAFTYDRQNIHVYVNGEHSGQLSYPVVRIGQENISSIPVIGKGFGNSQNYFDGIIDDIRIYDRALTDAEMAELYRDKDPPAIPTLISPDDGAVNDVSLFQTFTWEAIWNASSYHIQLSLQQDFSSLVYEDSTLTSNFVAVGPLASNQKYYWRVRAKNDNGTSSWSGVRYFTIAEGVGTVYFDDTHTNLIKLGNNYYELTLLKSTGAISSLVDKIAGQVISEGTHHDHLWGASFFDGNWGYIWVDSPEDTVSYEWNAADKTLTFTYKPNYLGTRNVSAQVFFKLTEDYYFDLQIKLNNNSGGYLHAVDLPYGLEMDADQIEEAILPLMPGAKLKNKYFEERRSGNIGSYPSAIVFADYIYFKVNSGQYGMYTVLEADITPNVQRELRAPAAGFNNYKWMHAYMIGLPDSASWESPLLRFRIGQEVLQTAAGFRVDTGINDFASIEEKFGSLCTPISQSLWASLDFSALFNDLGITLSDREVYNQIWNQSPSPSILFLVGWEKGLGGSDATAPDIFPVDPRLGTDDDLRIVLEDASQAGHLVMPYINPTIWNSNSPTVQSLLPEDFARFDIDGNPVHEYYDNPLGPQDSYSTCPYAPTVINRIQKVFSDLQEKMPINLVFEDQIGPRGGLDYSPLSPSPAHYPQGWLEHTRRYQDKGLTTEFGYDRLIETHVGFLGNLVLWDRTMFPNSTWGGFGDEAWGSGNWEYYPIVPIMAGDKVSFISMAGDTPTKSKAALSWNIAMKQSPGYGVVVYDSLDRVWRGTVVSYQKHVLSRYYHERMVDYIDMGNDVTKSCFATHEVLTNWSKTNTLSINNHTLATEGFLVTSNDLAINAGIFTNYNGLALSSGDHFIIETRYADSLILRHPQGQDTPIRLDHRSLNAAPNIYCFAFVENSVFQVPVEVDSQYVSFNLKNNYNDYEVDRYVISGKPIYLSTPELTEPENWANIQIHNAVFKWEGIQGSLSYQIQIAKEDTFQLSMVDSALVTETEFTSNKLEAGNTYFWRARALNNSQTSNWSFIYRFRVDGINIADRLVAHYPLDGNADDAVGNSHGKLMGDIIAAPDRFGNENKAYSFDGDADYIVLPESEVYSSIDKQITVSAWIHPTSLAPETGIMLRGYCWYMFLNNDGTLFGIIFNESEEQRRIGSSAKVPLTLWSFIAVTYDGQYINVYLNGRHSGKLEYPIERIGREGALSTQEMGRGFGNFQNDFNGRIDEVRVYDRALSSAEMAELYRRSATENFSPEIITFSPAIDTAITEGDTLEFFVEAQDEDNDTLLCTWSYDDSTIVIDTTTYKSSITISFPKGSVGRHLVKASVSDGKLTADKTWNVTVEEYISAVHFDDGNIPMIQSCQTLLKIFLTSFNRIQSFLPGSYL